MAYVDKLYNENFLEYASYVVRERAIPHLNDGLKPVQRRILHSLFEIDDGRFHKVANVVGHVMKYHPHGDASIFSALTVLANKELFIDKQGNFGNIFTGDMASAARYIECRLLPLAKDVLFNPDLTEFVPSYDGRNREPVTLPAKIPVVPILGTEGIAVGMSTKVLPHNFIEVLESVRASLQGEQELLFPDFLTGGYVDVSEYDDGCGKVLVRAKIDTGDPKKIVIRELPFGSTTESIMNSIETAAKKNKIKISSINDYTAENVEIEIKLARGVYAQETVDALFAFTECENSISVNPLVIRDNKPVIMSMSEMIQFYSRQLVDILKSELKLEENNLNDRLHAKTLEQIFIENRVYKEIEDKTTSESVKKAVFDGLEPFKNKIRRQVTKDDVESLLKIPLRRISLYDINKANKEIGDIKKRLKEVKALLDTIIDYSVSYCESLIKKYRDLYPRQTEIVSFEQVDVREAAQRNLKLKYDSKTGYIGYGVSGNVLFDVSPYDRILIIRKSGAYSVIDVPEKLFVDKGMNFCGFMDGQEEKNRVFTLVYRDDKTKCPYIKRCKIEKYILSKGYSIVPENSTVLKLTTDQDRSVVVDYKPKPRVRVLKETFDINDFLVKGVKAKGVRLANREVLKARFVDKENE